MPEIGAWVLGEACRQMHKWQGPAWQPFRLAVNVSASQVGPTFDDEVKRVLADMALPVIFRRRLHHSARFEACCAYGS